MAMTLWAAYPSERCRPFAHTVELSLAAVFCRRRHHCFRLPCRGAAALGIAGKNNVKKRLKQ